MCVARVARVAPLCSHMCAPQHDHAASAMGDRVFITAHTDAEVCTFYDADYRSRVKDLRILALTLAPLSKQTSQAPSGIVVALSLSSGAWDIAFGFL